MSGERTLFHYTADIVLATGAGDDDQVLLIQRGKEPFAGSWALPGGHVDAGETAREAVLRELEEETGIALDGVDPAGLVSLGMFDAPGRDPRGHYVSQVFTHIVPQPIEPTAGDDAAAARWYRWADVPGLGVAFDHGRGLERARRYLGWLIEQQPIADSLDPRGFNAYDLLVGGE